MRLSYILLLASKERIAFITWVHSEQITVIASGSMAEETGIDKLPWCTYKLLYLGLTSLWKLLWATITNCQT